MAVDNLNYYSSWLPAWQQTDKYTSQPWCLKSKNLDIFSSSKSVKATAWSVPSQWASDIIKQDGDLILKTDWKVYELVNWVETLFVDPSVNFPSYNISYNWINWTYAAAQWGTVKDMVVKYEWDEWKSFVVYTDRASYTYSKTAYVVDKELVPSSNFTYDTYNPYGNWYRFTQNSTSTSQVTIEVNMAKVPFATVPIKVYANQYNDSVTNISIESITWYKKKYYYDPQDEAIVGKYLDEITTLPVPSGDIKDWYVLIEIPAAPFRSEDQIRINFRLTKKESSASNYSWNWELYISMNKPDEWYREPWYENGDFNEYYSYLPIDDNRHLVNVWEYYWMPALSFQTLYNWQWSWTEIANRQKVVQYDFVQYMWWENDTSMDVIGMITWNEQVYMIWNMNWNWYIIPCDLSWGRWTPYIAYWCTFRGVTNIDYLMYLVWEDRGISQLRVYNWQELVPIIWWNKENNLTDYVDTAEQYKFDWKMVEYRWDLVLTTTDNRVFQYWQTFGGKWWTFIHEVPWDITELKADGNDLIIKYTSWGNNYSIIYQDDIISKNYNTEWEAEYPIVIWNHLLEKEESDLYASYILPNSLCSLEFWGMANHYHFWTFKSSDNYTFSTTADYKMKGCTWNYVLKFIEKNDDYYTFRLEGDLPLQTVTGMKITDTEWTELISYSEYNHFRKIWEITADGYQEWEFRFHNLNNKLELPKSYSLQIMVRGKWTANYTPELFALDLVANQRERW